jgi:cyclophilin family peptidyl-prolyl cis-trans isomerase/HEAT repeat protein
MKKITIILFLICSSLFAQQTNINDEQTKTIRHILELQDKRNGEGIEKYLQHPDDIIVKQAIVSLSNIGQSKFLPSLLPFFQNENLNLKMSAAFTLGHLGVGPLSPSILLNELRTTNNSSYKAILFEALGRIGGDEHLDSLLLVNAFNHEEEIGKIWGVTRFALHGIKNSNSIFYLFEKLNSSNEEIITNAAFALSKSTTLSSIQDDNIPKIISYTNSLSSLSKSYLIIALGVLHNRDDIKETLLNALSDELVIQLSALRVLEKYPLTQKEATKVIDKNSDNEHFNLAKYRFLYRMRLADTADKKYIAERINNFLKLPNLSWREKAELLTGKAIINGEDIIPDLLKEVTSTNDKYNAKIIRALSEIRTMKATNAILYQIKPNNTHSLIAQLEAIARLRSFVIKSQVDKFQARHIFLKALKSDNMPIITTVINSVSNDEFENLLPIDDLISAFNKLKYPDDLECMIEFINLFAYYPDQKTTDLLEQVIDSENNKIANTAMKTLYDIEPNMRYIRRPTPDSIQLVTFHDWQYFDSLCSNPTFELNTEKGKIKLLFFPHEAPFTSISIAKLTDEKYFDGLDFHRVVSNFVVQGGDPTGTGYGGPGYTIRTEISHLKFETGYVGMASSGKDTESSQFFITHSPQPNLDGRYTIFAKVIEGMDVVNKIQEGDKIISFSRSN